MMPLTLLLTLIFLLSPISSNAADKTAKKESKKVSSKRAVAEDSAMRVLPLDPYFPVEQLPKNYQAEKSSSEVLSSGQRDQFFQAAGLSEAVKGWDHFEKDILYMRVKNENINEVVGRYPLVPADALQRLKRLIAR